MNTAEQRAQEEHSESIRAEDSQDHETTASQSEDSVDYRALAMSQEQKLAEAESRLLRLQADFDNFRRRSRQEKEELYRCANKEVLAEMLPVIDNFQRALAAQEGKEDSFTAGVTMIYQQFYDVLLKQGLTVIEAEGQLFDPNLHEAVMMVEDDDYPANTVVEEMQKGYKIGEKVLRTSVVKVANCN